MNLSELSPINFATADPQELDLQIVSTVENLLGRTLARGDPLRLFLRGLEAIIIQQRLLIDETAKQNLLAYSTGNFLDHLGALVGCERLSASKAVTTVEITLSTARQTSTTIKKGSRLTAGDEIYFALDDDVIFVAGETTKTCKATCTAEGESGNGYAPGELNKIVDPQAFLLSIVNTTTSEGGADTETDDNFRERIRLAPESFSCAGSKGSYIFHAKSVSQLISDVAVDSDTPGNVQVYILLKDGQIPGEEILSAVNEHLNAKTVRPLTDNVTVLPAQVVEYDLNVRYWTARSNAVQAAAIVDAATAAVQDYVDWQRSKMGLDIVPDELIHRLINADIKRCEIDSPQFTKINAHEVAEPSNVNVEFAGLEDD